MLDAEVCDLTNYMSGDYKWIIAHLVLSDTLGDVWPSLLIESHTINRIFILCK